MRFQNIFFTNNLHLWRYIFNSTIIFMLGKPALLNRAKKPHKNPLNKRIGKMSVSGSIQTYKLN